MPGASYPYFEAREAERIGMELSQRSQRTRARLISPDEQVSLPVHNCTQSDCVIGQDESFLDLEEFGGKENTSVFHPLIILSAEDLDPDSEGRLHYSLEGNEENFYLEMIDENNTAELRIKDPLDMEQGFWFYTLTASVTEEGDDFGNPALSDAAKISIEVLNQKDTPPIWTQFPILIEIEESTPINTKVGIFKADDGEATTSPREIKYELLEQNDFFNLFTHTNGSCILELLQEIDVDAEDAPPLFSSFELKACEIDNDTQACDNNAETIRNVNVQFIDINDNDPKFNKASVETNINMKEAQATLKKEAKKLLKQLVDMELVQVENIVESLGSHSLQWRPVETMGPDFDPAQD
ncbi:unnamed protein product [Cyprideis torosa]|uniref:Uncharacterized protein n=1 Tax=Cyprideis torosa TaxID=163714 RepID=A0A7R8WH64_9CRUS|nr:unnamed protein product [Cyprideis torosa]CAG0893800.1 unnamed protein product [Cyprideis torosa]